MRLGIGHGPRFHLNLFGARCRWPCLQGTTSSISSQSTNSSILDNDHTSSWTYIQYANSRNSDHNGSTFNDTELISLVNEGAVEEVGDNRESRTSNEGASGLPWLNANDRHARRDVRTLFPEEGLRDVTSSGASFGHDVDRSQAGAAGECQYVNLPLVRDQNGECIPFYTASRTSNSNTSTSSHGSRALSELFDFESQLGNAENSDWVTGGDHPYGIPSTLLGGVLLNLDNQLRLSANTEWQNWSDFLTSAQEPADPAGDGARTYSGTYESMLGPTSTRSSNLSGAASLESNDMNNSLNNENTANDNSAEAEPSGEGAAEILPNLSFPRGRFFHHGGLLQRHLALPPPPSSSSSTRSSGSGSSGRPRQQEWYFYDPRLVPEQRTERVTLDTSFRGLRNRCVMSSIIQPPAYDDVIQNTDVTGGAAGINSSSSPDVSDPPPPYTETEPPPSYDQSFGHTLAFPTFNIGLPVNPLERRLAASLCTSPLVTSNPVPEPDLLMDVNIDELLDGPAEERNETDRNPSENEEENEDELNSSVEMMENEEAEAASDSEPENSQFSLRRYPVGFCLGRRPPLRWSRGMAPNRWAPQENWANP